MDTKLKNSKYAKIILFLILVLSISLMSLVLKGINRNRDYKGPFFESKDFAHYISSNVEAMYDEVDDSFKSNSTDKTMSVLKYEKNIKYIVVNNETNKIFTNTKYKTISEFRDYTNNYKSDVKEYVEIEG
ncbi:MAG: hypothetical protein ACRC68_06145, partial [Clostridium sp.]